MENQFIITQVESLFPAEKVSIFWEDYGYCVNVFYKSDPKRIKAFYYFNYNGDLMDWNK